MRFLNKFYSFMKSIYLNNSKYSNNLRHSLRIFFEREVKTKNTPMLFGSTFKGSKWVDYQTFNINKLFIKSGLSYFYYIFIVVSLLFFFLGRSKSEQYFGFLPFFSYINFLLGYIPLVFSDITSQIILVVYITYTSVINLSYRFFNKITNNTLLSLEARSSGIVYGGSNNNSKIKTVHDQLFNNQGSHNTHSTLVPFFSKNLSNLRKNLSLLDQSYQNLNNSLVTTSQPTNSFLNNNSFNTYIVRTKQTTPSLVNTVSSSFTNSEGFYSNSKNLNNFKIKSAQVSLNDIHKLYNLSNYPVFFNFNLEKNLNMAKQQRWLTKNSLLSESIMPNSFLVTQSKKLIGLGFLDKDFTDKTL